MDGNFWLNNAKHWNESEIQAHTYANNEALFDFPKKKKTNENFKW